MSTQKTNEEYCHGCYEKTPCQCRTDWYDEKTGKVIDSHENKLRQIIKQKDAEIEKLNKLIEILGTHKSYLDWLKCKKMVNPQEWLILKISALDVEIEKRDKLLDRASEIINQEDADEHYVSKVYSWNEDYGELK